MWKVLGFKTDPNRADCKVSSRTGSQTEGNKHRAEHIPSFTWDYKEVTWKAPFRKTFLVNESVNLIFRHINFVKIIIQEEASWSHLLQQVEPECWWWGEAPLGGQHVTALPGVRLNHERKSYNSQTLQNDFSCGILSLLKLSSTGTPETGQPHISAPAPGVRQGWSRGASGRTPPLLTGAPQNAPFSARLEYLQNEQMEGIPRNKRLVSWTWTYKGHLLKILFFFVLPLWETHSLSISSFQNGQNLRFQMFQGNYVGFFLTKEKGTSTKVFSSPSRPSWAKTWFVLSEIILNQECLPQGYVTS